MALFDRVFADVRKDIPSVADAVLRQELFRVLDDFTQYTNVWQETLPLAIVPNVRSYNLTPPTNGKINRLLRVYDPATENFNWTMGGITMRVPGTIVLSRTPVTAASWSAIVAKRTFEPLDVNEYPVIDAWIVERYADTIGRGILARLQIEPQKPYSNPMLAQVNQRAYIAGRSLARLNDGMANVFDGANWRFPQGWSTNIQRGW